jgi:hypothetical protein
MPKAKDIDIPLADLRERFILAPETLSGARWRSRVLLSAIFATLGVALAGCAAPLSRGYYAGGYPYGIHGYYCGEWSVWPGVSCVHVGPPERVYPPPADP